MSFTDLGSDVISVNQWFFQVPVLSRTEPYAEVSFADMSNTLNVSPLLFPRAYVSD